MVSREQATGPMWKVRMLFLLSTTLEKTIRLSAHAADLRSCCYRQGCLMQTRYIQPSRSRIGQTPTLSP
jgi:hypothetical protein